MFEYLVVVFVGVLIVVHTFSTYCSNNVKALVVMFALEKKKKLDHTYTFKNIKVFFVI
jgi:hypothetical protein